MVALQAEIDVLHAELGFAAASSYISIPQVTSEFIPEKVSTRNQ
jgi:hypothetical protein